eukprot:m51a1_g80 hypothetical protein (321) ;mRNA; r:263317-264538
MRAYYPLLVIVIGGIDFKRVRVHSRRVVRFTLVGGATDTVEHLSVRPQSSPFSIVDPPPLPHDSLDAFPLEIEVEFAPVEVGVYSAWVDVVLGAKRVQQITLRGEGKEVRLSEGAASSTPPPLPIAAAGRGGKSAPPAKPDRELLEYCAHAIDDVRDSIAEIRGSLSAPATEAEAERRVRWDCTQPSVEQRLQRLERMYGDIASRLGMGVATMPYTATPAKKSAASSGDRAHLSAEDEELLNEMGTPAACAAGKTPARWREFVTGRSLDSSTSTPMSAAKQLPRPALLVRPNGPPTPLVGRRTASTDLERPLVPSKQSPM